MGRSRTAGVRLATNHASKTSSSVTRPPEWCVATAIVALGAIACARHPGALRLSNLEIALWGRPQFNDSHLRILVGDPGQPLYRIGASDFTTTDYGIPQTRRLQVPTSGSLPVRVVLLLNTRDTLAVGDVQFRLEPGYRYGLSVQAGGRRPEGMCVGPVTTVPIRWPGESAASDTLFLVTGGLPEGAVC
jgi:hypothetical protein